MRIWVDFFYFLWYNYYKEKAGDILAHKVLCKYCGKKFDRDTEPCVYVGSRRYAHKACFEKEAEKDPKLKELEIILPDQFVTCRYCKEKINKTKDKDFQVMRQGFAHIRCIESDEYQAEKDIENFFDYVLDLYSIEQDYVPPNIRKQAKDFAEKYSFTYSGMKRSLEYYHEVQGHPIKYKTGINIIPYVYQEAYNYYYALWLSQQRNNVDLNQYIPKEIEISIPSPQRRIKKKKVFTFLDEDEIYEQ